MKGFINALLLLLQMYHIDFETNLINSLVYLESSGSKNIYINNNSNI